MPETIRVTADHVIVDVRVVNRNTSKAIKGLTAGDFEIFEDGVRQQITHFSQDAMPVSAVLLLDVSGSIQGATGHLRRSAFEVMRQLKPEDEVALIAYGSLAQLVQDFTKDRRLLAERIGWVNDFYIGPRGTQLAEAVYQAAAHLRHAATPGSRRYIIAVTDDVSDWAPPAHTRKQALDRLLESGASLCGITIVSNVSAARSRITGRLGAGTIRLQHFAGPTGGEVISASTATLVEQLGALFEGIRSCYSLGYTPSNPMRDGKFRKIRVRLKRNVLDESTGKEMTAAVIARIGYYATPKPSVLAGERNAAIMPDAESSLTDQTAYYRGTEEEEEMLRCLFLPKETKDFKTSLDCAAFLDPRGETTARISLRLHPQGVHLKRGDDGRYAATFRLLTAVLDQSGMIMAGFTRDYRLALDVAAYQDFQRTGVDLSMVFPLPPGKYQIRTVLRDLGYGKMSALHASLEVASPSEKIPDTSSSALAGLLFRGSKERGRCAEISRFSASQP